MSVESFVIMVLAIVGVSALFRVAERRGLGFERPSNPIELRLERDALKKQNEELLAERNGAMRNGRRRKIHGGGNSPGCRANWIP